MLINGRFGADLFGRAAEIACFFGNEPYRPLATIPGEQPGQKGSATGYTQTDGNFTLD